MSNSAELSVREREAQAEIINRFTFHPATPETAPMHDAIRNDFRGLAAVILDTVPEGRHQSLALTALQESMMWCNAAVACDS